MSRHHDNWIEAYSKYSNCQSIFDKWAGLGIIASALGNQVWIDMGYTIWHPNMFLAFVASPSICKSMTVKRQVSFLNRLDNVEVKSRDMIPKIPSNFSKNSNTFIALHEPDDFDIEGLHCLAEIWDSLIPKASINMSMCCTQDSFNSLNNILKSRSLEIFCNERSESLLPKSLEEELYKSLMEDLRSVSQIEGEYSITDSAKKFGTEWFNDCYVSDDCDRRMQIHLHKIAMVIAASECNYRVILRSHLEEAVSYLESLK